MPIFQLPEEHLFPPSELADENGIVAVGGDTHPNRLLEAYRQGIFPWPHEGLPLLWFSPDPRFVLEPKNLRISRSLKKAIQKSQLIIKTDQDFESVMTNCASVKRSEQSGTWITKEMTEGYLGLHQMGYAHSIEGYENHDLVGGLYGISLGGCFFGESMFSLTPNASKICFVALARQLAAWNFDLIDCQQQTQTLERLGALCWTRKKFLKTLRHSLHRPTIKGPWKLDRLETKSPNV